MDYEATEWQEIVSADLGYLCDLLRYEHLRFEVYIKSGHISQAIASLKEIQAICESIKEVAKETEKAAGLAPMPERMMK